MNIKELMKKFNEGSDEEMKMKDLLGMESKEKEDDAEDSEMEDGDKKKEGKKSESDHEDGDEEDTIPGAAEA